MFDWAGTIYDWYIDWPYPIFPTVGETFAFGEFVTDGIIKDFKDVHFEGRSRYAGLKRSIFDMLQNDYHTKIVNVNWRPHVIELEITTTIYNNYDSGICSLWKEIRTEVS
jgi:hypothetical protein